MQEELYAMPSLSDHEDFGLSDSAFNRKRAHTLLPQATKLESFGQNLVFYHVGDHDNGAYFVFNSERDIITFFQEYKKHKALDVPVVTQTSVWRSLEGNSDLPGKFAERLVFEILLNLYPAIMSDVIHTQEGMALWIRLIDTALDKGHAVRLYDLSTQAKEHFDLGTPAEYRLWVSSKKAWHRNSFHMNYRFVIFK